METSINDNGFDQEEWKKVQPQLQKTWDEYAAAGKTSDEFIDFAAEMLGSKGKPYFDKYAYPVSSGIAFSFSPFG